MGMHRHRLFSRSLQFSRGQFYWYRPTPMDLERALGVVQVVGIDVQRLSGVRYRLWRVVRRQAAQFHGRGHREVSTGGKFEVGLDMPPGEHARTEILPPTAHVIS